MSQTSSDLPTSQWGTGGLTKSERYELLSDERRRAVLETLEGLTAPVQLAELAAEIADRTGVGAFEQETTKQVQITLHHNHLPKMDDMGVIDYDPDSNRIDL